MAVPIKVHPRTPESKSEIEARLADAQVTHAKAILSAYELLQELHDARVLDLLRGALGAGDTLVTKLAVASNSEQAINVTRNMISLTRILGSVDPELLHRFADEATREKPPKPSLWNALRMFLSADSRRALVFTAGLLQVFGRVLGAR